MRHTALRTVLALLAVALSACASGSVRSDTPPDISTRLSAIPAAALSSEIAPRAGATIDDQRLPATSQSRDRQPTAALVETIIRGNASRRVVALTFDAGSDAGYTSDILNVLVAEDVRATFSVTGLWAEQNHDLLLAIAASGHEIINHTYDHKSFTGVSSGMAPLSPEQRALELSRTEVTVYHLAGRSTRLSTPEARGRTETRSAPARTAHSGPYDVLIVRADSNGSLLPCQAIRFASYDTDLPAT